ncbi:hypothetical protein ABIE35_004254 [Paenarthrobacter sp. 4246]
MPVDLMLGAYVTGITLVFAVIFKFIAFTVFAPVLGRDGGLGRSFWPLRYSSDTPRWKLLSAPASPAPPKEPTQ